MKFLCLLLNNILLMSVVFASENQIDSTFSSNLPIIVIDTKNQIIEDNQRKIMSMGIIANKYGQRNCVYDPYNEYDGKIAIEIRGVTSQEYFPKKSYAFETQKGNGENFDVSLLGMPKENDWILHGPYSDKTLIRNVLAYKISNTIGRYASRTHFCELFIDAEYNGVYVVMEKIKRDKNRVDIEALSDSNYTGGYLLEMTAYNKLNEADYYFVTKNSGKPFVFKYPDSNAIIQEQYDWIKQYIDNFEDALFGKTEQNPLMYIDEDSFIDYMLVNEALKNGDVFFVSTYLIKDRNCKLKMGPVWDFNIAMGNINYQNLWEEEGFWLTGSGWSKYLLKIPEFFDKYQERWQILRSEYLTTENVHNFIDQYASLLDESQERNFQVWPVIGEYVWPNYFVGDTYEEEISYLKDWIEQRFDWLDANLPTAIKDRNTVSSNEYLLKNYPNPFNQNTIIHYQLPITCTINLSIYNNIGQKVVSLVSGKRTSGDYRVEWNTTGLTSGVYFCNLTTNTGFIKIRKLVLLK